jgi:hypothetical protein
MLRRAVLVVITGFVLAQVMPSAAAQADPLCTQYDDKGFCLIWVGAPGNGGSGSGGADRISSGVGNGNSSDGGILTLTIGGQRCAFKGPSKPQPDLSDPLWDGHTDGAVYDCEVGPTIGSGVFVAGMTLKFWAATPPGVVAPPDPRVLAQQAVATMQIQSVTIGIVPEPRVGSVGIIGMPTWMWAQDPSPTTWGPITRTASAGGFTVTATAHATKVVWMMGDGAVVTCTAPGTPYDDSYGKRSSPDCGHTYTRQGKYAVTATSYWVVNWNGLGQSGQIPLDFSRTANITMGEAQVLSN